MKVSSVLFISTFVFVCQGLEVPLTGPGMTMNLVPFDDLESNSITLTPELGAMMSDDDILLPVGASSVLSYSPTAVMGGRLDFTGGMILSKPNTKVALANFTLDIKTGLMKATMDQTLRYFGGVHKTIEAFKHERTTNVQLRFHRLTIEPPLVTAINQKLGVDVILSYEVPSFIACDVNLVSDNQINMPLVNALKLQNKISPNMTVNELFDLMFLEEMDL